jgi:hypothetical protein
VGEWLAKKVTAEGKANDPTNAVIFLQAVTRSLVIHAEDQSDTSEARVRTALDIAAEWSDSRRIKAEQ